MKWTARKWFLLPALAALGAAWLPPLGTLADGYLFSAHMAQHLLLQLVVPPLVLLGLERSGAEDAPPLRTGAAVAAWLAGVGAMWVWHDPALCNAVVRSPAVRLFQYATLLAVGMIFWWPIAGPRRDWRLPPLAGIFYLFSACFGCTVLGIIITFAPPDLYARYFQSTSLPPLFTAWELSPGDDQRLGGLLMWVPGCFIYMTGIFGLLFRWYAAADHSEAAAPEPQRT